MIKDQIEVETNAKKFDIGKYRPSLLPTDAIKDIIAVLEHGAEKYGAYNWRKGMEWTRLYDAAMRHLWAWLQREDVDPDSGCLHLAHAACNLLFLLEYYINSLGVDDRFNDGEL